MAAVEKASSVNEAVTVVAEIIRGLKNAARAGVSHRSTET
jgi:hypothetical protein